MPLLALTLAPIRTSTYPSQSFQHFAAVTVLLLVPRDLHLITEEQGFRLLIHVITYIRPLFPKDHNEHRAR